MTFSLYSMHCLAVQGQHQYRLESLDVAGMAHMERCTIVQALFRKIAAALPGMESLSAARTEDLVDVNLSAAASQNRAGIASNASSCAC